MGYRTSFVGTLKFNEGVTLAMVVEVKRRLHCGSLEIEPDKSHEWNYMDFELTEKLDGLKWDGSENFYGAVQAVNWLVAKVRGLYPAFSLNGTLKAQGEDTEDRWLLIVENGNARKMAVPPTGRKVTCPRCDHKFYIEGE